MVYDLTTVGQRVGNILIHDLSRHTALSAGKSWRGTMRYSLRLGALIRTDSPLAPPRDVAGVPAEPGDGRMTMHVRLERSMSIVDSPRAIRLMRVINLSSIGMCEEWRDRGLFTGMISELEAYVRSVDRLPGTSAEALCVSSIVNLAELLDNRGWLTPDPEGSSRIFLATP